MPGVSPAPEEETGEEEEVWVGKWSISEQHVSLLPFHLPGTKLAAINSCEVHLVEDAQGMGMLW